MMTPEQQAAHEAAIHRACYVYEFESTGTHVDRMTAAVTDYQTAMAADVRAAVTNLKDHAVGFGIAAPGTDGEKRIADRMFDIERALLDLCGATPGEGE